MDLAALPGLPGPVIDPHIHQWDPLTTPRHVSGRARLLSVVPRVPRALWWALPQSDREFIGNPHHILKPYPPDDYVAKHSGLGTPMWASNYPIDKPGQTISASASVLLDVLGDKAQPQKLFSEVARRTYRL